MYALFCSKNGYVGDFSSLEEAVEAALDMLSRESSKLYIFDENDVLIQSVTEGV